MFSIIRNRVSHDKGGQFLHDSQVVTLTSPAKQLFTEFFWQVVGTRLSQDWKHLWRKWKRHGPRRAGLSAEAPTPIKWPQCTADSVKREGALIYRHLANILENFHKQNSGHSWVSSEKKALISNSRRSFEIICHQKQHHMALLSTRTTGNGLTRLVLGNYHSLGLV